MAKRVCNDIPTMADIAKDKLFTCPYNTYHRITALKYPGHVSNCRKQYTGSQFVRCPFNARHEFPEVEYDYHVSCCPDKAFIEKELQASAVHAPNVQPVSYESNEYNPEEDWESEANHVGFSITGNAHTDSSERTAYDVIEDFHNKLEETIQQQRSNVPVDTSGMSKAQKKNYKRAQKRREANGTDNNDDAEEILTEEEKEYMLEQIAREYAIPGRPIPSGNSDAFVDWVSILNQYCQKNRINQPKYSEASNPHGGFGSAVVVTTERFFSNEMCDTKKKAKHSAARSALLGLNIAVSMPDPCRAPHVGGGDRNRERELEEKRALLESQMPQQQVHGNNIPGYNPASSSSSSRPVMSVTRQMAGISLEKEGEDDSWQLAGGRRRDAGRPSGNALRLAGVGRGRSRK